MNSVQQLRKGARPRLEDFVCRSFAEEGVLIVEDDFEGRSAFRSKVRNVPVAKRFAPGGPLVSG
jgi:hypothetical protein